MESIWLIAAAGGFFVQFIILRLIVCLPSFWISFWISGSLRYQRKSEHVGIRLMTKTLRVRPRESHSRGLIHYLNISIASLVWRFCIHVYRLKAGNLPVQLHRPYTHWSWPGYENSDPTYPRLLLRAMWKHFCITEYLWTLIRSDQISPA